MERQKLKYFLLRPSSFFYVVFLLKSHFSFPLKKGLNLKKICADGSSPESSQASA